MQDSGLYGSVGGKEGCRELSELFYARVARDPVLRPLFPAASFRCAIEALATFLAQFLGGPCEYADNRWSLSLREAHQRFKIGQKERAAWLKNMRRALKDAGIEETAREALLQFFEQESAHMVNLPAACPMHGEIAERFAVHRAIEDSVAAVRAGAARDAIALAERSDVQSYFERDRGAWLSLLAVMSGSGHPALLDYTRAKLTANPALAHERYTYGRTLLHEVAGAGSVPIVELLLRLGADPNAVDRFGHTPLYHVGNACGGGDGAGVVHALARAGANVDARASVKQCTALHMAARRGNIPVAAALLECNADPEARDRVGDTPLQRAVNCRKKEMAAFLRQKSNFRAN